ncbi:hypothetical protein LTR97_007615 [Elasticomyces elasticus]|uniref:Uncharacterized protein n=1 Tax=Elasticomyces elasticus TaxID=574655 RepID=A0AAN8A104_9PEZI|nr:hypothetical protein LTR97_007615 [Elasticomyces elasticus]
MLVSVARPGTLARLCSASSRLALVARRPLLVRHLGLTPHTQLKNAETRRSHYRTVSTGTETASTEPLPIAAFLERVKDGSATIDDAQCCLEHHYSILADLPPSTRQEQARSLSVGGQLLEWLWEVCHDDRARVYDDQLFSNRLCWFLVLEDLEDLVWKWIKMETKQATESPNAEQPMHPGRGPRWTGKLLGGLAQAHLDLAPGRVVDNALRRFQQVADLRSPDGTGFLGSQLVQMRVTIQRALLKIECLPCDTKLFDHFVASTPVVERPDRVALTRARLRLFHPTKPTAPPMLHLVRVKHPMVEKVLREARPAAIRSMTSHMLRAACILCLENADDDASFLEALVQQKDPKLWYNREKFWSSQTADPKLESLVEASERRGELSHIPARWSTTSALLTQVPRTRPLSVSSVRNRSFSQCARPQVIVKQGACSRGSATISDAQSCVLHHYTKVRRLPQNEHGDAVKKSAIGSEVLSWLLSLGNEDLNSNFKDVNFRNALSWLLVLEGKEDSVWEIIQDIVSRAMQNTGESVMHRHLKAVDWTGRLLAGFAAAHLDLAPRRIADNAIKCLERLVTSRMTGVAELPLAPMTTLLGKELRRSACTPCSPKAFDQFLTLIAHDEGPRRIELARARFILFHPTQATARPFLELVRTNHPELTVILCARSEARNNLSSDLMRAAYILRVEGSEHDATYLENIVQNLTPLVWHARERIWQDL